MKKIVRKIRPAGWLGIPILAGVLVAACAVIEPTVTSRTWQSRAIPASQAVVKVVDGQTIQQRYPWGPWGTTSFDQWPTHAYDSPDYPPPEEAQLPAGLQGDPDRGRTLFADSRKGPCTACHLIPDADIWPMGNVGPDLRTIGDRGLSDNYLHQVIHDPRVIFGADSPMAPFGASGILSEQDIADIVAWLQTLKGNPAGVPLQVSDDRQWNPFTRDIVRPDYGDSLDPTANPALDMTADVAVPLWERAGPVGRSCAGCHGAIGAADETRPLGVIESMVGVGVRYPRWFAQYRRMMSIEDFLSVHGPETTGHPLPTQGQENLTMTILVKMQSNGLPYRLDVQDPNVQAAIARGQHTFAKRVGQRGQACVDCHTERGGADRFLGGRLLANVDENMIINHPYYRTSQGRLWDIRMRMQFCMTPLRTNMLAGDAPEYADLETFLIYKQMQREVTMLVPRHYH